MYMYYGFFIYLRRKIITSTMHPPLRNHIYVTIKSFISNNKPQQLSFWIPSDAISEQKSKYRSDLLWFFFQNTNIYTMACTIVYPMYHQSYKDKHKGIILSQIVSLSTLIIHYSWLPFWWSWSWSKRKIKGKIMVGFIHSFPYCNERLSGTLSYPKSWLTCADNFWDFSLVSP